MSSTKLFAVSGAVVLMLIIIASQSISRSLDAEYPEAPFEPVGPEIPRFVDVRDAPPRSDQAAWQLFRNELQNMWQYRMYGGAVANASSEEQQAVHNVWSDRFIDARQQAEDILHRNPQSIPALYTLASVEAYGQSNLPYALFLARKLRHRLEAIGNDNRHDDDAREWYLNAVILESDILKLMDRREEELRCITLLEQLYGPLPWMRIWPLIKLERFDEARKYINLAKDDGRCPTRALNGLAALEDRMGRRKESYEAGLALTRHRPDDSLMWHNFALSAWNSFRYDEAERAFRRAADMNSLYSPWLDLAILYTQEARIPEAFDALKKANQGHAEKEARYRDQEAAMFDIARAQWLLVTGHTAEAEQFARRAARTPDRAGLTSIAEEDLDFSNGIIYWTALTARLQERLEDEADTAGSASVDADTQLRQIKWERWRTERELASQLTGERLLNLVRPNVPGGAGFETGTPAWLRHGIAQIVAPGVLLEAVRQAREIEDVPDASAYLDGIAAEAHLRRNAPEEARRLAKQALDGLQVEGEKLLRCRIRTIAGEACRRLGDMDAALGHWDTVLRTFPQCFRLIGVSLPVAIETDNSDEAEALHSSLLASPRFHADASGFRVRLSTSGNGIRFEFDRAHAAHHLQQTTPLTADQDAGNHEDIETTAHRSFHEELMQPFVDFSQTDLDSLNGSPSAVQYHNNVGQLLDSI